MILDLIAQAHRYEALADGFAKAFAFLEREDLAELPDGQIAIDGDRVFATIVHAPLRAVADAKLEAHDAYIDIQYVIRGTEQMGWAARSALTSEAVRPPEHQDVLFFDDAPQSMATVPEGHFAIFFPHDAHMPLIGEGSVHKVIVKVAV
ncbi:MAG: YhcH/YjgK/YiaL family protein [Desulfovibrionales bacterium]|nr:YhcH/YjgK/YiaL family protein [Desulfovibrionales bacterium]